MTVTKGGREGAGKANAKVAGPVLSGGEEEVVVDGEVAALDAEEEGGK